MIKLFEEFFDDVDIEEVSVDDGLNLDTEYNHSMDVMICPFYLSTDCEVNDNKFSLFFKKLNAYCENCVSFDDFKIELNYEYKDATGKQITGTVDSDFVDIVQQYNKSHSEGRCNFMVSIKFIENKSCSFDNFKKDLNAIFKLFYRLCIDHYYVEETFISFEFIQIDNMIVFKTKDDIETWFHNNIKKTYEDIYRNQDSINEEHKVSSFYNGPVELSIKSKKKAS